MKAKYLVAFLVVVLVVAGAYFFPVYKPVVVEKIGSMPGNNLELPDFTVNGVRTYSFTANINKATTTLAVFKNPSNGTSSIVSITYNITTGTGTAATIVAATSTSAYSTSSVPFMAATTVAANALASNIWRPAVGNAGNGTVIGPNEYILVKTEGVGLSGYTYVGKVRIVFQDFSN